MLLLLTVWLGSACTPALTQMALWPAAALDEQYDIYRERYTRTFHLSPRPAASPLAAAEAYLQRYQPGPLPRVFQNSFLYDRHGVQLAEVFEEGRRTWVSIDKISPYLIKAIVATEDASFFTNRGIDERRLVAAVLQNAVSRDIVSGASTITMQLARQLFFTPQQRFSQSIERKIYEIFLARELTEIFTKDEILEMYLNLVYFGHLAYGPEAAAKVYFGKTAADLTQAEATLLAGIPQKPGELDLFRNMGAAKTRQRTVLDLMVRRELLSAAEAKAIFVTPVTLGKDPDDRPLLAPHFVAYTLDAARRQFGEVNVRRAGLHILTTLDLRMQQLAEGIVAKTVKELKPRYNLSNAALVALKPGDAEILVMVGSADYYNAAINGAVNVAIRPRQPGSALKPVLFATAFDENLISPASVIWDLPVGYRITPVQVYRPVNYDSKFHGPVTARMALANSYNVPAVKLLDRVGTEQMRQRAIAMGVDSFRREDTYGLGMTLGSNEVTLIELTTVYHTLANQGAYTPPTPFRLVTDGTGRSLLPEDLTPRPQVVSPEAAYLVTDILSDNAARTPAFGANSRLKLSRPAAVKTGTSSNWRDNWTVGYTRYLVAGVWAGNSNGRPMYNVSGVTGAGPIWNAFMEGVMADPALLAVLDASTVPEKWEFRRPPDVVSYKTACLKYIQCRPQGELFARSWLRKLGAAHAYDDSLVTAPMATVFVNRGDSSQNVGVCAQASGVITTALRLPAAIGMLAPPVARSGIKVTGQALPALPITLKPPKLPGLPEYGEPPQASFIQLADRLLEEYQIVFNWSSRTRAPLYLGRCADIVETAPALFGKNVRSVTLQTPQTRQTIAIGAPPQPPKVTANTTLKPTVAAPVGPPAEPSSPTATATPTPVTQAGENSVLPTPSPLPTLLAALPATQVESSIARPLSYHLLGVAHDTFCPGNYILGQVLNNRGAPIAGARVLAVDQWGNRSESITKSSANDLGRYDFPILSDRPRDFSITVVDDAGNPLSETILVQHQQGAGGNAPCHHVVWIGN